MATVDVIVNTDGTSGDYGSLNAAESDKFGAATGDDVNCECRNAGGDDVSAATFSNDLNSINVFCDQDKHTGTKNTGYKITADDSKGILYPRMDNVTINGLEVGDNPSGDAIHSGKWDSLDSLTIKNSFIYDAGTSYGFTKADTGNIFTNLSIYNNVFLNNNYGGMYILGNASDTGNIDNNTIYYNNQTGQNSYRGGVRVLSDNPYVFTNNAVFDNYNADFYGTEATDNGSSNNATSDSSGNSGLTGLSSSNQFTDISSQTDPDLSLLETADLVDAGADLSGTFSVDIVGTSRPQGSAWDIGAFEYVVAGGATVIIDKASLGLSGNTISANESIVAQDGSLSMSGQDVTATTATLVTPGTGILELTGGTTKANQSIQPGTASLGIAGGDLQADELVKLNKAALGFTGQKINASTVLGVDKANIALSGQKAKANETAKPQAGSLSFTGQAISFVTGTLVEIGKGAFSLTGKVLYANEVLSIKAAALTFKGLALKGADLARKGLYKLGDFVR